MKYLSIAYFVILFGIMGSYFIFATPDNSQRLHLATTDQLSMLQHNKVQVWARDLNTGSHFSHYRIESRWIQSDYTPVPGADPVQEKLPDNGEIVLSMPPVPTTEVAGLEVLLYDEAGNKRKSGIIPSQTFLPKSEVAMKLDGKVSDPFFYAVAPAAFMFNQPNEIMIALFENQEPWKGTLNIEQSYGDDPADYLKELQINGIARLKVAIAGPSDFKIQADEKTFYLSYVLHEKTIHAVVDSPFLSPEHTPVVSITPFGNMPEMTIDYFDENAWFGRQVVEAHKARRIELDLDYVYDDVPTLFYARVSGSAVASQASAQTFPIIASKTKMTEVEQATFALKKLKKYEAEHPEHIYLSKLLKQSKKSAPIIRDYALALVALHHDPSIETRVRTEEADQVSFEHEKAGQKAVMNVILVVWFGLGLAVSLFLIIRNHRRRKIMWDEVLATGTADAGQIPPQTSGVVLFSLLILFIGFMVSLYFMMQII